MAVTPAEALLVMTDRKRAYVFAFGTQAGKVVLDDLAGFCRAAETCIVAEKGQPVDRDRSFAAECRREVYLRIRHHLDETPEQLLERYTRPA